MLPSPCATRRFVRQLQRAQFGRRSEKLDPEQLLALSGAGA